MIISIILRAAKPDARRKIAKICFGSNTAVKIEPRTILERRDNPIRELRNEILKFEFQMNIMILYFISFLNGPLCAVARYIFTETAIQSICTRGGSRWSKWCSVQKFFLSVVERGPWHGFPVF